MNKMTAKTNTFNILKAIAMRIEIFSYGRLLNDSDKAS